MPATPTLFTVCEGQLPDRDTLARDAPKALVVAQRSGLDPRDSEIESLKLLIFKLKPMQFWSDESVPLRPGS